MHYLLDTNVVSDLIHDPQGRVAGHIGEVREAQGRLRGLMLPLPTRKQLEVMPDRA